MKNCRGPKNPWQLTLLLLGPMTLPSLTGCKATETNVSPLIPAQRMDRPERGKNKIWVELQDMTAQSGDFEDRVWEAAQEAIEDRGYVSVELPEDADCVLEATLRMFDEVEDEQQVDAKLASLGGGAGGGSQLGRQLWS